MVHAMARDHGSQLRVAWLGAGVGAALAFLACRPQVRPDQPFPEEAEVTPGARRPVGPPSARAERQLVVGEMCPQGAAGRPAIAPLVMRALEWVDTPAELTNAVERGSTPRFSVFGSDGKVAGVFDTVGLADLALGQSVAAGTYVGAAPCSADAGGGQRTEDPACAAATRGCGLAVAELARPDDPPPNPVFATDGACATADALAVDVDHDGAVEWFPLAGILDSIRGPAQEWSASQNAKPACAPKFTQYGIVLAGAAEPGKPANPKAVVLLDLLGVVDLDGDGRSELVIALRFPAARTIVVYGAPRSPGRLELLGEAQSFAP